MSPLIRHYPTNRIGRTFVAGDLHGCYNQFRSLLAAVGFDVTKDVCYQTGDLINRGPSSRRILEMLEGPRTHPDGHWLRPVQGNHDLELVRSVRDNVYSWEPILRHGGRWAYELHWDERVRFVKLLEKLPVAIAVGEGEDRFNVFHGEWHASDAKLDQLNQKTQPPVWLVGGRDLFKGKVDPSLHEGLSPSFVGHNIVDKIKMIGSHIYLDTGSYLGENPSVASGISLIEPSTQHVWQYSQGKVIRTA